MQIYLFAPIAVETLGPMNTLARQLFANLGKELFCSAESFGAGAALQRCIVT